MQPDVYARFGVTPIINAVGYATRVSGSCPHPDVVAAMAAASGAYVELDDLLAAASQLIARCTGAQAGLVTAGAGAALTLAAAACLAGNNPDAMDRLPDVAGLPRTEIVFPAPGPFDYDHALRLSGARLVMLDYTASDALARIEAAISPRTAAVGYVWYGLEERPNLDAVVALARRHKLPVILDGAFSLPPEENLTAFVRRGVDLVAFSGGKHLGGPQASGILCGRAELIRSAWVQMVDMDVRAGTWSQQRWIDEGWIARPPRHGLGRSMKISKEGIVGVMAALERFALRDHAQERQAWRQTIDEIYAGIGALGALRATRHAQALNGQPYPLVELQSGLPPRGMPVRALLLALRARRRKILLAEDEVSPDRALIYPQCLRPGDAAEIVAAIREAVAEHAQRAHSGG